MKVSFTRLMFMNNFNHYWRPEIFQYIDTFFVSLDVEQHIRVRRSPQVQRRDGPGLLPILADEKSDPYSPPISYKPAPKGYKKGRVGPVYTFVKTDPYANFKWGVRHVVGTKYGR